MKEISLTNWALHWILMFILYCIIIRIISGDFDAHDIVLGTMFSGWVGLWKTYDPDMRILPRKEESR